VWTHWPYSVREYNQGKKPSGPKTPFNFRSSCSAVGMVKRFKVSKELKRRTLLCARESKLQLRGVDGESNPMRSLGWYGSARKIHTGCSHWMFGGGMLRNIKSTRGLDRGTEGGEKLLNENSMRIMPQVKGG